MQRWIAYTLVFLAGMACKPGNHRRGDLQVLIYNYCGEGFVHENIETSTAVIGEICSELGIKTAVADTPSVFEGSLDGFDAIIFCNTNAEAFHNEAQRMALQQFVRKGGGIGGVHSASTSEPEWDWFVAMMGGSFTRHPKLQDFSIQVLDRNHPSTRHLPAIWAWEDEPYYHRNLNPDIRILLAGDLETVEENKPDEVGPETPLEGLLPLAWCQEYDGGRQWFTALGHKDEYYHDSLFREHLKGGIRWILNIK